MATVQITGGLGAWLPVAGSGPELAFLDATPYYVFGSASDQLVERTFRVPSDYVSSMTVIVQYSMSAATSNNVALRTQTKAVAAAENRHTATFSTLEASADQAVPATAGLMKEISDALGTPTIAAGDLLTIQLGRENGTSGTNASTGNMRWWSISLTYANA